jgi:S1-C subfamily serine protease
VEVIDVMPHSPAAAAGVESGDWIVSAAGRIIAGTDDLHRILAALKDQQPLQLQIVRGERMVELTIRPRWISD